MGYTSENTINMTRACAYLGADPREVHNITVWNDGYSVMYHSGNGYTKGGRIAVNELWQIFNKGAPPLELGEILVATWENNPPIMQKMVSLNIPTEDRAVWDVLGNAAYNAHKKPNMRTLFEEFCEAGLADRNKHEHPLRLELVQIAGVAINMIRRIDNGEDVSLKS